MIVDRRHFLGLCASIGAAGVFRLQYGPRVHLLVNHRSAAGARSDIRRGVIMGVEEAQHAAVLFQSDVAIRPVFGDDVRPRNSLDIWVLESPRWDVAHLPRGAVIFNANNYDSPRDCNRNVFHVVPRSRDFAVWSPGLSRFGADTLNKRFLSRFSSPMTEGAWAGWFAVKVAWEAALKSKAMNASELIAYLERPTSRFDGHKGSPLYFDAAHELVQPVYGPDGQEHESHRAQAPCTWKS
jgi:hypothetical protein